MSTGISLDQLASKNRNQSGRRSKHTQHNRKGQPIGSNTKKGKRAY